MAAVVLGIAVGLSRLPPTLLLPCMFKGLPRRGFQHIIRALRCQQHSARP